MSNDKSESKECKGWKINKYNHEDLVMKKSIFSGLPSFLKSMIYGYINPIPKMIVQLGDLYGMKQWDEEVILTEEQYMPILADKWCFENYVAVVNGNEIMKEHLKNSSDMIVRPEHNGIIEITFTPFTCIHCKMVLRINDCKDFNICCECKRASCGLCSDMIECNESAEGCDGKSICPDCNDGNYRKYVHEGACYHVETHPEWNNPKCAGCSGVKPCQGPWEWNAKGTKVHYPEKKSMQPSKKRK
jgi:hypothetical protein